ncbi:GNAT family N-acetyltransferase [Alienimonas chondri]|uniref:N-acetyltransferase domain-containing protein n=1 Tax=Alienimonas chondri TaxID=2681879 RepID=A0ABX1VAS7_9PLAN|nr:GNAT family N-acetyltransferase [Alienimonas chondri]NNJ24982.1 hypothetical protein [Alienimonas chondri]
MATLAPITPDLFPKLYDAFLRDDDPLSGEAEWRNVFDYAWEKPEGHAGYALLEDGEAIGFLGMIFSRRTVDGREERFCNLHTWWVREDRRGHSLALLRPITRLRGYTITHFTPGDRVRAVLRRLGFADLSSQLTILPPPGRIGRTPAGVTLSFDADEITNRVSDEERRLLTDHRPYPVEPLLVEEGGARCLVLHGHVLRHRLPYVHVSYFSDRDLFLKREPAIRAALLDRYQVRFAAVDTRLVPGLRFPRGFKFWAPANALFKSERVPPERIDNLYSDVTLLALTTLPDLTHEISERVRRLFGLPSNADPA